MGIMNTDIQDFGEKIGGARKDLWRRRGLKVEDLDNLELKEYAENVTKENIWPTPDYVEMCKHMPKECAYYTRFVREKLQAKLELRGKIEDDRSNAEGYIEFINTVRQMCNLLRTDRDILDFPHKLRSEYIDVRKCRRLPQGLTNNFLQGIWIGDYQLSNFKMECEIQGFPEHFYGVLKGARIYRTGKNGYKILGKNKYLSEKEFSTLDEALEYCHNGGLLAEIEEKKKTKKVSSIVHVVRPQLEHIERIGPNVRGGYDTTTDMMLDTFKFRGGEFGNWNNQDDRQACLNYAFDALIDLAYILGVSPEFISLG